MTRRRKELSFLPGPLTDALARLNRVYVETRMHAEAIASLRRLFLGASVAEGHLGLAIVGPSGVGKTTTVRAIERWLRSELELPESAPSPLPLAMLTSDASPKALVSRALQGLGDPAFATGAQHEMEMRFAGLAPESDVYGLAFDEMHHCYQAKSPREADAMERTFKNLVNNFRRPIIVMGVDGLDSYLMGSNELSQRFQRIVFLENLAMRSTEDVADMVKVLTAMNEVLPCEPGCYLTSRDMVVRIFVATGQRFGSVVNLIRRACEFGAMEGAPRVALKHYSSAYKESAPRNARKDEDDPFLMPMDKALTRAAALNARSAPELRPQSA